MLPRTDKHRLIKIYVSSGIVLLVTLALLIKWVYWPRQIELTALSQKYQLAGAHRVAESAAVLSPQENRSARHWLQALSFKEAKMQQAVLNWASRSHVHVSEIKFEKSKTGKLFNETPVSITTRGNFLNEVAFLFQLANAPFIFSVDQLSMTLQARDVELETTLNIRSV